MVAADGVNPPSAGAEQSSMRWAPALNAVMADSRLKTAISKSINRVFLDAKNSVLD